MGSAYRPLSSDRLNLFVRYALVYERERGSEPTATGPWSTQTSHVVAGALVADLVGPFAVSPKVAYRYTLLGGGGSSAKDQAVLAALRGDLHLGQSWDAAVEGRGCGAPGTELATRYGVLTELSLLTLEWLRLGAGYNFSSISAQGVRCEEPGARGFFVRAEALY